MPNDSNSLGECVIECPSDRPYNYGDLRICVKECPPDYPVYGLNKVCKKFVDHYVIDQNETKHEVEKCEKYYILDTDNRQWCVEECR